MVKRRTSEALGAKNRLALIPVSVASSPEGVYLLLLDWMLVHHRSLPSNLLGFPRQFAGTHSYSWVERGNVRVKCLAQ